MSMTFMLVIIMMIVIMVMVMVYGRVPDVAGLRHILHLHLSVTNLCNSS